MAVAVYVRVSTLDQKSGIESQEKALREYLANHGIETATWYRDMITGATTDRPAFNELQKAIFNGKHKTVVVWKLDRLSRSLRDGVNLLHDWLDQGIRIVSITQQLDLSNTMGKLVAHLLLGLAEMERENLRENTKRGMAAAKARGVKLGKRPRLFKRDIKERMRRGRSVTQIARSLGKSRQALYDCLRREGTSMEELRHEVREELRKKASK